jgi:hypothetical protein
MLENNQIVLRMKPATLLTTVVVTLVAVGAVMLFFGARRNDLITRADSISPDGMFRVIVTEEYTRGHVDTRIRVYLRRGLGDELGTDWAKIGESNPFNDSAGRSNFSVVWTLGAQNKATAVRVFGDFGSPPFDRTELYTHPLPANPRIP